MIGLVRSWQELLSRRNDRNSLAVAYASFHCQPGDQLSSLRIPGARLSTGFPSLHQHSRTPHVGSTGSLKSSEIK